MSLNQGPAGVPAPQLAGDHFFLPLAETLLSLMDLHNSSFEFIFSCCGFSISVCLLVVDSVPIRLPVEVSKFFLEI